MTVDDLSDLSARLSASERVHARLEGLREGLRAQEKEVVDKVAMAKGRNAIKKDVESFIEQIQAEAYRKTTHSFSTLLTTLVQEVLPHGQPVNLELTTERGLPALHLFVRGNGGVKEDVFEDHGGALNNVIGMGLRLIAVVKANGKRFLALDEPECWVSPSRIPAFFKVLEDSAQRLGVQTLTITHHDAAANFGPDVRISTLRGTPETGARIEADRAAYKWQEEEEGFRWIRLQDFQTFVDTTVSLGPGVNALVGPNDHGKSSIVRALRAVFYGEARDSLIRHNTKGTIVEIGIRGGRTLRFSRERRRNPKNLWSLHEMNGDVVVEKGMRYETGGNKPPEWVDLMFGMSKVDDLDIHLAHQKHPVFLLDRPASQRASVLAIGQEAGYTSDMLAIHREWTTQNNAIVREGEERIAGLRERLAEMTELDEVAAMIAHAQEASANAKAWIEYVEQIERIAVRLNTVSTQVDKERQRMLAFSEMPGREKFDSVRNEILAAVSRERVASDLLQVQTALQREKRRSAILSSLPEAPPKLQGAEMEKAADRLTEAAAMLETAMARATLLSELPSNLPSYSSVEGADVLERLLRAQESLVALKEEKESILSQSKALRDEMDLLLADIGGNCPTCGHATTVDDLLADHIHEVA